MQYIALFSQDGLAITDMYQETVLYNVSYPWTGDVHFSNVVSPTNFSYILTTICKEGTGAHGGGISQLVHRAHAQYALHKLI